MYQTTSLINKLFSSIDVTEKDEFKEVFQQNLNVLGDIHESAEIYIDLVENHMEEILQLSHKAQKKFKLGRFVITHIKTRYELLKELRA